MNLSFDNNFGGALSGANEENNLVMESTKVKKAAETKQGFGLDDSLVGIQTADKQVFKSNVAQVDDEIFGSNVQVNAFDDELLQPAVVEDRPER